MTVPVSAKRTALLNAARERILVLDGAMGTMIQNLQFDEKEFRGERFKSFHRDLRGNNDFLQGEAYGHTARMSILPDPSVVVLEGGPAVLMHGDTLCTDDKAYQAFRTQTRDPKWQAQFLAQPLAARIAFAQQARAASQAHQSGLKREGLMEAITDVAPATVDATMARFGIPRLIHGHTHRPKVHEEAHGTRIVLGDWYEQGSVLRVDRGGATLSAL